MTDFRSSAQPVRIGTRGSPLALAQARQVASALEALSGGALRGEITTITTSGDRLTTERLTEAGGKGLFTKEIDLALDDGRVDIAVHSLKDVPSALPAGQIFAAFAPREDPREAFISALCGHPRDLPEGGVVGTASLRREAQTLSMRPDLRIETFRGNVQTRMKKLSDGLADATYLAMAGLRRLGLHTAGTPIPLEDMLPAPCQGIVAVAAREDALPSAALEALAALDDAHARACAVAERAFLAALDGSCRTPIAAHLFRDGEDWRFEGEVLSPEGGRRWRATRRAAASDDLDALARIGREAAAEIRDDAGPDLPAFA